ncbi:hypothetical protein SNEBB_003629 [Seison nebaliae]|nr:hypothetical protein SNEBB_003629 [Seison nebaliae]
MKKIESKLNTLSDRTKKIYRQHIPFVHSISISSSTNISSSKKNRRPNRSTSFSSNHEKNHQNSIPDNLINYSYKHLKCEELVKEDNQIDLEKVQQYSIAGCNDEMDQRHYIWKLLFGLLPIEHDKWEETLNRKRKLYFDFAKETLKISDVYQHKTDHPLNNQPTSKWNKYFDDNQTLQQIDIDTRRLFPEFSFFQKQTEFPLTVLLDDIYPDENISTHLIQLSGRIAAGKAETIERKRDRSGLLKNSNDLDDDIDYCRFMNGDEAHWEVVERILFIYSSLHTGYVQGMNEILGPIYYVMATSKDKDSKKFAEPDSFWCFVKLMTIIRENFDENMDNVCGGIRSSMTEMEQILFEEQHELSNILSTQMLKSQFFAFRWILLLGAQEFNLPEILRIWDLLFAFIPNNQLRQLLICLCVGMIKHRGKELKENDFANNLKSLQNFKDISGEDLQIIIYDSLAMYKRRKRRN